MFIVFKARVELIFLKKVYLFYPLQRVLLKMSNVNLLAADRKYKQSKEFTTIISLEIYSITYNFPITKVSI